ncbi:hypothetical protein EV127DRAFT_414177 [Xylaria flabelliformis]|nr:hypothetical protein EV127DRAFT_414177 [Xylaria flabelliformis]
MYDQVEHLMAFKTKAVTLNSEREPEDRRRIMEVLRVDSPEQYMDLLYVTPGMITQSKVFLSCFEPYFSVPFSLHGVPEIAHFVAREQELAEMRETLQSDGRHRVVVLHSLGGMGKTQLATEYMKRHRDNYSAIFWLNIKDENSVKQSFARIAHQIKRQHPAASRVGGLDIQENLDEMIDAVKA